MYVGRRVDCRGKSTDFGRVLVSLRINGGLDEEVVGGVESFTVTVNGSTSPGFSTSVRNEEGNRVSGAS